MSLEQEIMSTKEISNDTSTLFAEMGRILILFQRIEHALKDLITLGSISVSNKNAARANPFEKQSLGQVAAIFIQRHLATETRKEREDIPEADEVIVQTNFRLDGRIASELSERIERAIPDRNRLAHCLITDFDLATDTGREAARRWVDQSHTEHSRLLDILLDHHRLIREALNAMVAILQTDEGKAELFLPEIQQHPIIQLLQRKAQQTADATWSSVSEAAKGESKVSIQEALVRFGMKSLTELMIASRLFELQAQESENGGTRMFYRSLPAGH